jgi:hypothetical protein
MRRFPAKTADPSISQKPRYCWVSAFCDAVVLLRLRHKFQKLSNGAALVGLEDRLFLPENAACAGLTFGL